MTEENKIPCSQSKKVVNATTLLAGAVGCLVVVGWIYDISLLKSVNPDWEAMKEITAVCLILSAISLALLRQEILPVWKKGIVLLNSFIIGIVGLLTLLTYSYEMILGREPIFSDEFFLMGFLELSGRMAIITAFTFVVFSLVFILLMKNSKLFVGIAHALIIPVVILCHMTVSGYVFGVAYVFQHWMKVGVAFHTSVALLLLCFGILCVRSDSWLVRELKSQEAGGMMARRLMPIVLIVPMVIGWVRYRGELSGFFPVSIGVTLATTVYTIVLYFLIWFSAKLVNHINGKRLIGEIALRRSENMLKKSQEIAHLGSWELDVFENKLSWSDEMYNIFGLTPQEFKGTYEAFLETVHPEDRKAVNQAYSGSVVAGKDEYEIEHRVVWKSSGEIRFVHEKCEHIHDKSGKIIRSVGMTHDITERRKVQDDLKISEQRWVATLASIGDAVISTDSEARIVFMNKIAEKITGWKFADANNLPIAEVLNIIDESTQAEVKNPLIEVLKLGKVLQMSSSNILIGKDGSKIPIDDNSAPIHDENGKVTGAVLVFRDISDRKKLEMKLQKANYGLEDRIDKRTRELAVKIGELEKAKSAMMNVLEDFENEKNKLVEAKAKNDAILLGIGDGLFATDDKGKIVLVNNMFVEMLGWGEEEALGREISDVVPMTDEGGQVIPDMQRFIARALRGHVKINGNNKARCIYKRKDGSSLPVAVTMAPIIHSGKVIGAVEVFRDISRESEIDKAKTEFVSLASHQLRTPLTSISWYAEMLLKNGNKGFSREQKKCLSEIYKGNQCMIALVNDLLNVSRIDLGLFVIDPKQTDIVALAQHVLSEQELQFKLRKQKLMVKFQKNIPKINVDKKLLKLVFQNLLSNAIKYSPAKGRVRFGISMDDTGENVVISVSDNGYGIPQQQQENIFLKFYRADNVREKNTEGTGLGLYIAKSVIDHSGGRIWFESKENRGTTFFVTLPINGMKKKEGTKPLTYDFHKIIK